MEKFKYLWKITEIWSQSLLVAIRIKTVWGAVDLPYKDWRNKEIEENKKILEIQQNNNYCDAWSEWLEHIGDFSYKLNEANILSCPYDLMQLLLKWHFDVFGLIPEGLAIDINTLAK